MRTRCIPYRGRPDDIGNKPECIVEAFNNIFRTNNISNDWRKSRMVSIFKGKGGVLECNNYEVSN